MLSVWSGVHHSIYLLAKVDWLKIVTPKKKAQSAQQSKSFSCIVLPPFRSNVRLALNKG
jgi:hypothetical protein